MYKRTHGYRVDEWLNEGQFTWRDSPRGIRAYYGYSTFLEHCSGFLYGLAMVDAEFLERLSQPLVLRDPAHVLEARTESSELYHLDVGELGVRRGAFFDVLVKLALRELL